LIATGPALGQDSNRPFTPSGEIQIPSGAAIDRMLDSSTVPPPSEEFSADDAKAIEQMDERGQAYRSGGHEGHLYGMLTHAAFIVSGAEL
jgi:hypothetical protein